MRFNTLEEPQVPADFDSGWTPTLIIEDPEGREHRRSKGYLDVRRLVEALYWKAEATFEISGDREDLTGGWEPLMYGFPDSEWAKKASYVRGRGPGQPVHEAGSLILATTTRGEGDLMSLQMRDHEGNEVTHGRETVNGVRLHYYTAGPDDPVLLLHGVPKTSYYWRKVVPLITAER